MFVYLALLAAAGSVGILYGAGSDGDDTIIGSDDDDALLGEGGNDEIEGRAGNDSIYAGEGNDSAIGGLGDDFILGGKGNDLITDDEGQDHLRGETGDDTLLSGSNDDTLEGGAGNDFLAGGAGNDTLDGGAGDDLIHTNLGADWAEGGDGNDTFAATADDTLFGGEGDDWFEPGIYERNTPTSTGYLAYGELGNDTMEGHFSDDTLNGGDGDDSLRGNNGRDHLIGGSGNDALAGGADWLGNAFDEHADTLEGGSGNDSLWGARGDDLLLGGNDHDLLAGFNGNDVLRGGTGHDTLDAGRGNDSLFGDQGDDFLFSDEVDHISHFEGGEGDDTLQSNGGDQMLFGGAGNDLILSDGDEGLKILHGDAGNDTLVSSEILGGALDGGAGDDIILDHAGQSVMTGQGNDVVWTQMASLDVTEVHDFDPAHDKLVIAYPDWFDADTSWVELVPDDLTDLVSVVLKTDGGDELEVARLLTFGDPNDISADAIHLAPQSAMTQDAGPEDFAAAPTGPILVPTPDTPTGLVGTAGADAIVGTDGADTIDGLSGADTLEGGLGNDRIHAGDDTETGGVDTPRYFNPIVLNADEISGGDGDDTLSSHHRNVEGNGGAGADLILAGSDGFQTWHGDTGNDTLIGDQGEAYRTASSNTGEGGWFMSSLNGDDGDDVLIGGDGMMAVGGAGSDTFVDVADHFLRIGDFDRDEDMIIMTVPDGTVLPDDGGVTLTRLTVIESSRYSIATQDMLITVNDVDGNQVAQARIDEWRGNHRVNPNAPIVQPVIVSPFSEGQISVMTESEATALLGDEAAAHAFG